MRHLKYLAAIVLTLVAMLPGPAVSPIVAQFEPRSAVWSWGWNAYQQLGYGEYFLNDPYPAPAPANSLTGFVAVAGAALHSLALKDDGTVWAWGSNERGSLGNGTTIASMRPVQVSGLGQVVAIAAERHSMALKSDGTVWAWGPNFYGELGNGTLDDSATPVQVSALSDVVAIAAGEFHSLALKADGTVWVWGYNGQGQLGMATAPKILSTTPMQLDSVVGAISIAARGSRSLALKADGTVWAWGGDSSASSTAPVLVKDLVGVSMIALGASHALAARSDGTVWAWGRNNYGQLGNGTVGDSATPVQVSGLQGVSAISAGWHSMALKTDGTLWTWGNNSSGQLGDGTTTTRSVPTRVAAPEQIVSIAAGSSHSLVIANQPVVGLSPGALVFGHQKIGAWTDARRVSVTNNDSVPLSVTSVALSGKHPGDFVVTAESCAGADVPPGGSCTVDVQFRPTAAYQREGTLIVSDNAHGSPRSVALSGFGSAPDVGFSPAEAIFGEQQVGTNSPDFSIVIWNSGTDLLKIAAVTLGGEYPEDYAIVTDGCRGEDVYPGGDFCVVFARFSPRGTGLRTAEMSVASNAPGSARKLALRGTGTVSTEPAYSLTLMPAAGGMSWASPSPGPYAAGTPVTLTATADTGYTFSGWLIDGIVAGSANPFVLVMNANYTVQAVFIAIPPSMPAPAPELPPAPQPAPPLVQDCSVYSCWASRGGILTDSPAAASFKGRAYVFARGTNFGTAANPEYPLFVKSTADGVNFSDWKNLGGNLTGAPAAVATSTRLYVFAKGTDDALYVKSSQDGVNFDAWKRLGGLLTAPPAAATMNGVVYVFAKGSDDALYVKQAVDGGTFGEWTRLGGLLTAAPAAVGFSGSVYVYARGSDDALYVRRLTNGKPSTDWLRLGGRLTAAPAAATAGGKLYVFANGSDSGLYVKTSTNGLAYGEWTSLVGMLKPDSTPAATGVGSRVFAFVWWADDALWERHTPK